MKANIRPDKIQIIISGPPGAGKTTLAKLIKLAIDLEVRYRAKIFNEHGTRLTNEQMEGLDIGIRTTTKPL